MDLALHLGMTAGGLSSCMPEAELREWQDYARRRLLPMRRIELYLAQLALVCARAGGMKRKNGTELQTIDFLLDPSEHEEEAEDEITVDDVVAQFGGRVYRKKG